MKMASQNNEGYVLHKGYVNVSDTVIYVLGFVFMAVGTLIGIVAIRMTSQTVMAVGLGLLWVGILLVWFSGVIGNKIIPDGFGRQK